MRVTFASMDEVQSSHPDWFQSPERGVQVRFGKTLYAGRFFLASALVPYAPEFGSAKETREGVTNPATGVREECVRRHTIYEVQPDGISEVAYLGTFSKPASAAKALRKRLAERPDLVA